MARASPPGAPGLDVESGVLRTFRDVGAHVHAEPSGNEITKSDAPCLGRVGVAEVRAGAPGTSRSEEADQRPARRDIPAQLGLRNAGVLILVAGDRDAAQLDEGKLVERHVAARGTAVGADAKNEFFHQWKIRKGVRAIRLILVVAADVGRIEHRLEVSLPPARGREEVVARVVLEGQAQARARHRAAAGRENGLGPRGIEARVEVQVDPARAEEVLALAQAPHELLRGDPALDVVAELQVARAVGAVRAVEVEVDVGPRDAAPVAPELVGEGHHAEGAADLGAVLRRRERHAVDVRRREAAALLRLGHCVADRFAEEEQRRAGAVADRRLGDEDRHRQEAFALEQPLGRVELAVLGILEGAALVLLLSEQLAAQAQGGNPGQPVCCSKKPHLAAAAPAAPTAAAARAAAAAETTAAAETAAALETAPRALLRGARLARLARVGLPVERVDRLAAAGPAAARGLLRRAIGAAGGLLRRPGARVGPVAAFGPIAADIRPGAAALAFAGTAFIF